MQHCDAQLGFGLPSIGGKDSMSGTFNEIDVPPTLVSFAVDVAEGKHMITPELKEAGDKLVQFWFDRDEYDIPIYDHAMRTFAFISRLIWDGKVKAAYVLDAKGLAAGVSKMAFGNQLGVAFADNLKERELFENSLGDLVIEMNAEDAEKLKELCDSQEETEDLNFRIVATVTEDAAFTYGDLKITME